MKKLIIVTGVSGIGKSTVSSFLYNYYEESVLISMDQLKENIYDIVGYKNKQEKDALKNVIYDLFNRMVNECMIRGDNIVIVEYPFSIKWQSVFQKLIEKYSYEAVTINVKTKDYEKVFELVDERNNSSERHVIHSLYTYNPKKKMEYKSTNEINYDNWKNDYLENKYTNINLGKVIDFYNLDDSYDQLIKEIEE